MSARLREAFAEGRPFWFVAAFLIVVVAPAALFWFALVIAGGPW
jgi:hypothetical protein